MIRAAAFIAIALPAHAQASTLIFAGEWSGL